MQFQYIFIILLKNKKALQKFQSAISLVAGGIEPLTYGI